MKNILLRCQASFQFVKFIFPFYRIKPAVAFVTRIEVTLQVVFFWSRYRLFANQTDLFTIELDKKYSSSHFNWNIIKAALFLDSAMMKTLNWTR